ncbi:MAG: FeoC-like transcriptional regulator [Acidimicrobiia bacterium]|nr:FeoC-like transcriptional regulator [Acidimicrobiia bacterium]
MMLSAIRKYLTQQRTASLADIASHVDADPDAVRGMLDHWVMRGKVCRIPMSCGGCTQCDPTTIETYRWVD